MECMTINDLLGSGLRDEYTGDILTELSSIEDEVTGVADILRTRLPAEEKMWTLVHYMEEHTPDVFERELEVASWHWSQQGIITKARRLFYAT